MQERAIQCKNVLSNARTFYPMQKHVYQCKKCVIQREKMLYNTIKCAIQRNKRDILQEKEAEKNCHYEKRYISN